MFLYIIGPQDDWLQTATSGRYKTVTLSPYQKNSNYKKRLQNNPIYKYRYFFTFSDSKHVSKIKAKDLVFTVIRSKEKMKKCRKNAEINFFYSLHFFKQTSLNDMLYLYIVIEK